MNKEKIKAYLFMVLWLVGLFGVAGASTFKYGYTKGIYDMKQHSDKFIYENCTCLGFTTIEELKQKEKEKYILPDNKFNFNYSSNNLI